MELMSHGYERKLLTNFGDGYIRHFNAKRAEQVKAKGLDVYYYIASRYKNSIMKSLSGGRMEGSNLETLHLEFDVNLSPDFVRQELDFKTGRSLTISLQRNEQGRSGNTKLIVSSQYINEAQEVFENDLAFYCPTVGGTIDKRLQAYKAAFDSLAQKEVEDYLANGFKVKVRHTVNNFAGYLVQLDKSKPKGEKFLCDYGVRTVVNKILIIYSIEHGDCFWKESHNTSLWQSPYFDTGEVLQDVEFVALEQCQAIDLDAISIRFKDYNHLFEEFSSQWKFDYYGFKAKYLALVQ